MLNRFYSFTFKNPISTWKYFQYSPLQPLRISQLSNDTNVNDKSNINCTGADLKVRIENLLNKNFPQAKEIIVKDISGGCGFMFEVHIASGHFHGMTKVKQHLSVSNILKEEIKDMHGIRIFTEVPE